MQVSEISQTPSKGIKITDTGGMDPSITDLLSDDLLSFLTNLERCFGKTRRDLLAARIQRQESVDAGQLYDFLPETRAIREGDWKIAKVPEDLKDRRVEITGPVDRKMVINALNCGARVYMADFEDAHAPTWINCLQGQKNLHDYACGTLSYDDPVTGKQYRLNQSTAVLMVRPRGWHLEEAHVLVDGAPLSASLFDFGVFFYLNAKALIARGTGPYFYLPKMESHLEARLWNDVFVYAQRELGIPNGTIKVTVLIETLPAAFEMDEILYELKDHMAGLNCGRWDYIFSFIKKLNSHTRFILPDRSLVGMGDAFLKAYSLLLIKTCHKRGAHAMGGMAAQIPIKNDEQANTAAFEKVRQDKEREALNGHDGTWVAHPALVQVALDVFDRLMPEANQIDKKRADITITKDDMYQVHVGSRSEAGLRDNIKIGIQYIAAWLCGRGAVPLNNLMEDTATAEISRAQIWQWLKYGAELEDGRHVDMELYKSCLADEIAKLKAEIGEVAFERAKLPEAIELFDRLATADICEEFLTLSAYPLLIAESA